MSAFEQALAKVLAHEGGYVHDPVDAGGETYRGVSRRFNPGWPGWAVIDERKRHPQFPQILEREQALQQAVAVFYRQHYWDRFRGDELPARLAVEMMDQAVHMGVHRAVIHLQQALNLLNRNQASWPDLMEDGSLGTKTMEALAAYIRRDPPEHILKVLNVLQGAHYLDYMRRSPAQQKYARGWLSRVEA